jgi:hypothetical protein
MDDKFLTTKKAAEFCGYNHIYFGRLMEIYKIPRYGPKRNRFKVSDLEEWMRRPEIFNIEEDKPVEQTTFRKVR